ncbi:MAG TPA: twin-arginine translocation signal domain-containing protein, partial [Acidobacteriaceae bacterium]|nr:twin-arginine translocation signal domain-containing protein [Acidobacteriaceae bacterium]
MSSTTRRDFLKDAALAGAGLSVVDANLLRAAVPAQGATRSAASAPSQVSLSWLGPEKPATATGVSWGVPWAQGAVRKDASFNLVAEGKSLPLQSWPMAYWPDGSLKWSGFATVVPARISAPATLSMGAASGASGSLTVKNAPREITIDTGALQCVLPTSGANILSSMTIGGKQIAGAGQLVCILQSGATNDPADSPKRERYLSEIKHVTVEQQGPVRAVVKIEGMHRGEQSKREWLPFTVRLYFYSGQTEVRLVHTIVFDGDQEKDFVRGLGVEIDVPMRDEPRNRTVRFSGPDGGVWSEPLQPGGGSVAQETGQPFTGSPVFGKNAIWDDFKLAQPTPDGFTIVKRTNPKSTWLFSAAGKRASGLASISDLQGGLGVCIKNFWQSYPSGLEVRSAASASAKLVAWLWSPEAPEMDMRFYDLAGHGLDAAYEDAQPGLSTAHGVARTSELTLFPGAAWLQRTETASMSEAGNKLPLLAASPEYIHSTGVFGAWSPPDRSTAFKKSIEDGLDSVLAYYERQVEDRSWYGFWQFGDFMHSYSAARHDWHYDWGGHAWDNTELGAPLWLWY